MKIAGINHEGIFANEVLVGDALIEKSPRRPELIREGYGRLSKER